MILKPAWATVSLTTGMIWAGNCHSSSLPVKIMFLLVEEVTWGQGKVALQMEPRLGEKHGTVAPASLSVKTTGQRKDLWKNWRSNPWPPTTSHSRSSQAVNTWLGHIFNTNLWMLGHLKSSGPEKRILKMVLSEISKEPTYAFQMHSLMRYGNWSRNASIHCGINYRSASMNASVM